MVRRFEQTLADIDKRCRAHKIPYTIIGGIAVIIHGYLRTTADVDVTILTEIDNLERILSVFADDYRARAKEFVAVERSDVPERLEELLAATKSRRKK